MIGLPLGADAEGVRNIIAAGGCTIRWRGEDIEVLEPTRLQGLNTGNEARH